MVNSCEVAVYIPNPPHPCNVDQLFLERMRLMTIVQLLYSLFGLLYELQDLFGVVARFLAWWRSRQVISTEQLSPPAPTAPTASTASTTFTESSVSTAEEVQAEASTNVPEAPPLTLSQTLQKNAQSAYQVVKETLGGFLEQPNVRSKIQSLASAVVFGVDIIARIWYTATASSATTIYFMEFAYPMLSTLVSMLVICALDNDYPRSMLQQPLIGLVSLHAIRVASITLGDGIYALQKL